ncbi:transglycosylase SLT domain-containing protein [Streptomyces sp. NPDC089919]|uniref:transglycosylase SLT domain-containing protein n=1 Tax=Streptomyces sp. NPDC089919 TaxID=3155188 RepID=UPI00343FE3AC
MPGKGKHRRPKNTRLGRSVAAVGTGGAALALPVLGATGAVAAPNAGAVHSVATANTAVVTAAQKATVTYSVIAGDSLAKIAEKHSMKGGWEKLYQDNRALIGDDPSTIRPGLKLSIDLMATPLAGTAAARDAAAARADRSARPATLTAAKPAAVTPAVAKKTYADNLDGWIRESLDIMAQHRIPGTYDGIYRNVMRESSGNPLAINNWDSNAVAGTPSKGLLQVIQPTFTAYHVPGTALDLYDPVANITAACNYAAARYGSIDNVFGAY